MEISSNRVEPICLEGRETFNKLGLWERRQKKEISSKQLYSDYKRHELAALLHVVQISPKEKKRRGLLKTAKPY